MLLPPLDVLLLDELEPVLQVPVMVAYHEHELVPVA